jgi:thiol peroxidase
MVDSGYKRKLVKKITGFSKKGSDNMNERKGIITFQGNPLTLIGPELKVDDKAPDFVLLDGELKEFNLKDFSGRIKVISVTPSLDTPVCDMQARRFNQEASRLGSDITVMNVSMDLPFAISRFCTAAGIERIRAFSDYRDASFGNAYGVLIKELRLLARAVFVVDKNDVIRYREIVSEITSPPDFDAALSAVNRIQ